MTQQLKCSRGHTWHTKDNEEATAVCPICGTVVVTDGASVERTVGPPDALPPLPAGEAHQSEVASDATEPLQEMTQFGRYRVTGTLGAGSFGTVYKGYDSELERNVAIKVSKRERISAEEEADDFLDEARILASLDHPGIVPVYDVGRSAEGLCYVVSKIIEGTTLSQRIEAELPTYRESAKIVAEIAEALHHAHRRGLIHRDVKPANILLDQEGTAYVTDFGLALREEDFCNKGVIAGTPAYMSPEQARGEGHRVDARSDIYSVGVVLYELLTGQRPFRANTLSQLIVQINSEEPRPPRQKDDRIPRELDRICLKALAKRAVDRYSTVIDMAEDVRLWLADEPSAEESTAASAAPVTSRTQVETSAEIDSRQPVAVVPKGLRSFDREDSEFFLQLLPGPRGRDGLPESVHFWKSRLEETDPDNTFRVGLIYGPSGCGKSSFVKAGLLPRLDDHVVPVYIEAAPELTESRLARKIHKACPQLDENLGLTDSLSLIRRERVLPHGEKIVMVIDQFEQWLHAQGKPENTELVQALRQCDGQHVQCVLMVRDDFWMAVTRFMRELEVDLVERDNSAAVDLFDLPHSQKVLGQLGAAYGRFPQLIHSATSDQQQFLQQATAELAEDGKIIPVRLALFAEMVKSKPWTVKTLHDVGGTAGLGVSFLEETFSARTANPSHRYHEKAARKVLKCLLPEASANLRGVMKSRYELLEASGYQHSPDDFERLMRILDSELRLVTPTEPEDEGGMEKTVPWATEPPQSGETETAQVGNEGERGTAGYYQLTHDYLVPSLRDWLTRKQRETWRGRAEICLAERTEQWSQSPQSRYLPSLLEFLPIIAGIPAKNQTTDQKALMRAAKRYYASRTVVAMLLMVAFAGAIWTANSRYRAQRQADFRSLVDNAEQDSNELWQKFDSFPEDDQDVKKQFASIRDGYARILQLYDTQADRFPARISSINQARYAFQRKYAELFAQARLARDEPQLAVEVLQYNKPAFDDSLQQYARLMRVAQGTATLSIQMPNLDDYTIRCQRIVEQEKGTFALEDIEPTIRAANKQLKTLDLQPGRYHIEVSRADGQRIHQFPAKLERLQDLRVELPVTPEDVPEEMVLVPAGTFIQGEDGILDDEKPQHEVQMSAYLIDRCEVSVTEYKEFLNWWESASEEDRQRCCYDGFMSEYDDGNRTPKFWNDQDKPNHQQWPVFGVDWFDAYCYAKWRGKRLPTEADWEKAARGVDGRTYPWGNSDPDPQWCSFNDLLDKGMQPVNSMTEGASPYGCLHLAGNAREWVFDFYGPDFYDDPPERDPVNTTESPTRVLRGGGRLDWRLELRCANRLRHSPMFTDHFSGFRCAKSLSEDSAKVTDGK